MLLRGLPSSGVQNGSLQDCGTEEGVDEAVYWRPSEILSARPVQWSGVGGGSAEHLLAILMTNKSTQLLEEGAFSHQV